jgi:hypothetical protein
MKRIGFKYVKYLSGMGKDENNKHHKWGGMRDYNQRKI